MSDLPSADGSGVPEIVERPEIIGDLHVRRQVRQPFECPVRVFVQFHLSSSLASVSSVESIVRDGRWTRRHGSWGGTK